MAVGLDPGVPGGYEAVRRHVPQKREGTEVVVESRPEISVAAVCPALAAGAQYNRSKSLCVKNLTKKNAGAMNEHA